MRGKYSPTVTAAYRKDKKWFKKYSDFDNQPDAWSIYDPEGFDMYGYDENEIDRAGNHECVYYTNDAPLESDVEYNCKYEAALDAWGFDGTKPVQKV